MGFATRRDGKMYKYLKWSKDNEDKIKVGFHFDVLTQEGAIKLRDELITLLAPVADVLCNVGLVALLDKAKERYNYYQNKAKDEDATIEQYQYNIGSMYAYKDILDAIKEISN
jgi:hypothetical protein